MDRRAYILGPVLTVMLASPVFAQQAAAPAAQPREVIEWMFPIHRTASPAQRRKTVTEHFDYVEMEYAPSPVLTQFVSCDEASFATPEQAFVSRLSAMVAGDYEWWMEHWDAESQVIVNARNAQSGETPQDWIKRWSDQLISLRFKLVRRVETGDFVVVTYQLVDQDGADASGVGLEFPTAFRKVEGRWMATQMLAADALMNLSPWSSGEPVVEFVGR